MNNKLSKTFLFLALCALLLPTVAVAQDTTAQDRNRIQDKNANRAGNLDARTTGANIRASQLMGMNIQNDAGEGVGEIKDIVLNARTGEVGYVAVTYGGFLGIGNDLHAVPFRAFKFKTDPDDKNETVLVLNVTQQQMEGAKGFNESTWPNFADKTFTKSIDKRYGVDRSRTYTRNRKDRDDDNDGDNDDG